MPFSVLYRAPVQGELPLESYRETITLLCFPYKLVSGFNGSCCPADLENWGGGSTHYGRLVYWQPPEVWSLRFRWD